MDKLVSINIPTYNSEKTLGKCLNAVKSQTYQNIEILVVDSYSKDKTLDIAKKYGCKIVLCKGGLLEARIAGAKKSKGKYVLLLDSDQILEPTTIERAVKKMGDKDYLWLYERAYNRKKLLPSLYDADRLLVQEHLSEDVVLPRFFKRTLLLKAFKKIPEEHIDVCGAQDHIVTTHEVRKLSNKEGMVTDAVEHMEPSNLIILFKKQYRWGKTTKDFYKRNVYRELITKKDKFRKFYWSKPILSIKSFVLRILRGIPYKIGFWRGK
jgi:glycosyltransferase involved in cell wall biosynthesis